MNTINPCRLLTSLRVSAPSSFSFVSCRQTALVWPWQRLKVHESNAKSLCIPGCRLNFRLESGRRHIMDANQSLSSTILSKMAIPSASTVVPQSSHLFRRNQQTRADSTATHSVQRFDEIRKLSAALQEAENKIAQLTKEKEAYQISSTPAPAFDTHHLCRDLRSASFNDEQAEALLAALIRVSHSYECLGKQTYATKVELNERMLVHKAEFATLRSELQLLEKADFKMLKADYFNVDRKVEGLLEAAKVSAAKYNSQLQELENKMLKALLASLATLCTVLITAWRFLSPSK